MNDKQRAIGFLLDEGILVSEQSYGFNLLHDELDGSSFAECGMDNDSSITLSMNVNESLEGHFFARLSFIEMAEFIIQVYKQTGKSNPSRNEIGLCAVELDKEYDDTRLNEIVESFKSEMEELD